MPVSREGPRSVVIYAVGRHGVGHSVRGIRIAQALLARNPGCRVRVITPFPKGMFPDDVDCVELRNGADYLRALRMSAGGSVVVPLPHQTAEACAQVLGIVSAQDADVFISTQACGVMGELLNAVPGMRAKGVHTLLALREMYNVGPLDQFAPNLDVFDVYDQVIALCDEASAHCLDPVFRGERRLERIDFVGYCAPPREGQNEPAQSLGSDIPKVSLNLGGGWRSWQDLGKVVPALAECRMMGHELVCEVLLGPYAELPLQIPELHPPWLEYRTWDRDAHLSEGSSLSITRAGYNNCVEAYMRDTPTLLIPWAERGLEQLMRARYFSRICPHIRVAESRDSLTMEIMELIDSPPSPARVPVRVFEGIDLAPVVNSAGGL